MTAAPEPPPPSGPRVWIVNADHWPRAYLRAELIERGYDAIGFETLKDALARLALRRAPRPALLILDLGGQVVDDRQRTALANAPDRHGRRRRPRRRRAPRAARRHVAPPADHRRDRRRRRPGDEARATVVTVSHGRQVCAINAVTGAGSRLRRWSSIVDRVLMRARHGGRLGHVQPRRQLRRRHVGRDALAARHPDRPGQVRLDG
jgi:hypothetical protein